MPAASTHVTISRWRFFDYVKSGDNKIEQWLVGNPVLRARLNQILAHLGGLRREEWGETYPFKWLEQKKYKTAEIGEVRFQCDGVEQRPVGSFGVGVDQFVLLIGCCKKNGTYYPSPPHPFDVAVLRKAAYLADPASVEERKLI